MKSLKLPKQKVRSPFKILTIGFLSIILVGAIILSLPISSSNGT